MLDELIEAWQIHNRINLYLLDAIEKDDYLFDMAPSKGRNIGEQFAHIHNVRLMWFKESYPELMEDVTKIEKGESTKIDSLKFHISSSGQSMEKLMIKGINENKIKGFKPNPIAFFGYIVSHESHHRGQIILSLKQSNHPVSKKVSFGIWQWGTK